MGSGNEMNEPGLFQKFMVVHKDDPKGKHKDCKYFVLDPQHDPIARHVLWDYARYAYDYGQIPLAEDISEWLCSINR